MSSRRGNSISSSRMHENPDDPAAVLCAFLMARRGWSCSRTALTLGIPPLVLEECIRNGVSSAAIRSQLALWIAENKDGSLPPNLLKAVVETAPSLTVGTSEYLQDSDPLATLDPVTESYFVELGSSVGQSFISILNDPQDAAEINSNWGLWLGSVVSGALDHKGQTKRAETTVSLGPSLLTSSSSSGTLLARYGLHEDYSSYLHLVTAPYNRNREESRQASTIAGGNERLGIANTPSSVENLPWPTGVPKEFFDSFYDVSCEVCFLERKLREPGGDSVVEENNTSITAQTFGEDFEVMETRMKELRLWESAVEGCLLQHVQSRSEQFFYASHEFGNRAAEAREALESLRQTRTDVGTFGKGLVQELLTTARCYRSRNNLGSLCNLAETVMSVSSQMVAIENWVALPERDMMELPVIVEIFCTLQDAILAEHCTGTFSKNAGTLGVGWITKVSAVKDIPRRVLHLKEKLFVMIMEELEVILLPATRGGGDDGHITRTFRSAMKMGIWPSAARHCNDLLVDALWTAVREAFIAFVMSHCEISDSTANNILSTAVTADSSREEKLTLFEHSNACRFPLYIELLGLILDHVLDFVTQAAQRWGLLLVDISPDPSVSDTEGVNAEDTRKYFSSLCTAAESFVALLLEVRSQRGKTPTNLRDLETVVSMSCAFLPNMVSNLQGVLEICGTIGDTWGFVSGRRIKSAVTRLVKEHLRSHHAEGVEKLRVSIENETWQPEKIDPAFQSTVDVLCRSDDAAIEELRTHAVFTEVMGENGFCHLAAPVTTATTMARQMLVSAPFNPSYRPLNTCEADTKKLLLIPSVDGHTEGRVVSSSILMLITLLHEFDEYLSRFPFLAFDVMGKIYDLLRLYDSQCAALLLGAMAVENGVLDTITTQHMAVASQNLAFLYDGIPLMQRRWLRATTVDKLASPIVEDIRRVRKDYATHRCEFLGKISGLVKEKVGGLGTVSAEQWQASGNEWVMTMLRETARLMRAMKPILPAEDCRGVVVPLLGTFARMIRSVTMCPAVDADLRAVMLSDVLLFKANVERFGFDVLRCAMLFNSEAEAMTKSVEPFASEADVVAWFFSDEGGS